MRVFAFLLAICLTAGCASKPDHYISAAPVTIPKTATYWLDTRRIQGGFMTAIVDDNSLLASVDFNYSVKIKKADAEILHFSQAREGLMPAGYRGDWQNMKTMAGVLSNSGNSGVKPNYTGLLSRFIVDDLRDIPSR